MSDHCKYHPKQAAAWFCQSCDTHFCNVCVPQDKDKYLPKCTLCRRDLQSLSVAARIPPFWQRLTHLLAMPFSSGLIAFILLFALILASLPAGKIGALLTLLVFMPVIEVIFDCMERTASGDKLAGSITGYMKFKVHNQSVKLLLGYALVVIVLVKIYALQATIGTLLAGLIILGVPASMIILMMEKSILSMFNPLKIGFIIRQFKAAYFLLYAIMLAVSFLAVKFNSAEQVQTTTFFVQLLVNSILLYLMITVAILAGYLVYQYHYELNFTINNQSLHDIDTPLQKDDMAEVNIFISEGRYEDAQRILLERIKLNPADYRANEKLILLYAVQGKDSLVTRITEQYFHEMVSLGKFRQAADFYQKILSRGIDFVPQSMDVMIALVSEMRNKRHFNIALTLIEKYLVEHKSEKNWEQLCLLQAQLLIEFANRIQDGAAVLKHIINRGVDQQTMQKAENYLQLVK